MSEFIPLSVPNFGAREAELAGLAITSGWVSTSGGKVTEFEEKLAAYVGMPRAVACIWQPWPPASPVGMRSSSRR